MARYQVRAEDQESGVISRADIGWSPTDGYFFIVGEKVFHQIEELPELINVSRAYIRWDRQIRQALERAAADDQRPVIADYVRLHSNDPIAKILEATR